MDVTKHLKLAGNRVIKTGLAIFITAWICTLLDWPPVFAVITAIVTIEPTVTDSIRKGLIRFPASAIGSAYAVIFISLFGDSPLTYTLAAVFTIATCSRLNLHAGLLVAALTSVAMVKVIHTSIFVSFFIRLGTTSIGLFVSTAINLLVLPPDYTTKITEKIEAIAHKTGVAIEKSFDEIFYGKPQKEGAEQEFSNKIAAMITRTKTLARFQREETKYHPLTANEKKEFQHAQKQLIRLQQIRYHLGNLNYSDFKNTQFSEDERSIIQYAALSLAQSLKYPDKYDEQTHQTYLKQLSNIFWIDNQNMIYNKHYPNHFPPDLIILYELVSIYNLVERYYDTPQ